MKRDMIASLAGAAGMIALSLVASFARNHGYIEEDASSRLLALNGLYLAFLGNRLPKAFVPTSCARQARRVGGWTMVLSGVVYAGVFLFAPIQTATVVGYGAVGTGLAVTLAYCLWLRTPPTPA